MSDNGEYVLQVARQQVAALHAHYNARRQAALDAFGEVAAHLEREGRLESVFAFNPAASWLLATKGPGYMKETRGALHVARHAAQRRAWSNPVTGVDTNFSKPLVDFARQLGMVEGRVDMDNEGHSLVEDLQELAYESFRGDPGATLTEAELTTFAEQTDERDIPFRTLVETLRDAMRFTDSAADSSYCSAHAFSAVKRSREWKPALRRLDDAVTAVANGGPQRKMDVELQISTAVNGVVAEMGSPDEALKEKASISHLGSARADWELAGEHLAALDELEGVLPEVWEQYLQSRAGDSLRTVFPMTDEPSLQEFLDVLSDAAAGKELKVVETIGHRGGPDDFSI